MNLFFSEVFQWWLILFLLGLTFLPLTTLIFSNFFDKGYALAKVVGLLLVSYLVWILGSIRLLPFTTTTIFEIIGLSLVINLLISYRFSLTKIILSLKKIILIEEIFFFTGLILWAWVRAHEPSIHGLEKFMDFGFINSLLRTEYFPPRDLWLTPDSINYYYFGHYVAALLTKISGLSSDITYNLVLATLFALTITAAFAIGANLYHLFTTNLSSENNEHHRLLKKRWLIVSGTMSAFLVALGGNLHTIYVFFKSYVPADQPVPFWQLPLQFNPSGYWYPNATRFIPFTIHEFPIYSFVVADLHGHVLDIPFVILGIALAIKFIYQSHTPIWHYLVFGLLIAVFLMTNVLDGPIYLLLAFLLILFKNLKSHSFTFSLEAALKYSLLIGASAVVFSLPFWIAFKPFASGIGVLCAPNFLIHLGKIGPFLFEANHCMRSPLWMLTILWGFFYLIWIGFIILLLRRKLTKFKELNRTDYLIILFGVFATILIMIPEFVYAKDIYPQHYRANTVFKFGYQAFITLGLIGGYGISRILSRTKRPIIYLIFLVAGFVLVGIYPYFAINSYYNLSRPAQGLNGFNYFSAIYPDDYQAILWLRQNIPGQPVILEAQGDSYTDFARVSANTGLPTVVGWPVHEWLWRGSYDEPGKRSTEVTQAYESPDINLTKALLSKYDVKYVFIGDLEKQKYLNLDEAKFASLGKVVYQNAGTRIYELN